LPDLLFAKEPNLIQKKAKKSQTKDKGPKKGPTIFSKFFSSYKVTLTGTHT